MFEALTGRQTGILGSLAIVLLAGCSQKSNDYQAPPPPQVTVEKPIKAQIPRMFEYVGTARASQQVDIRSRVTGFLEKVSFTAGKTVTKDQTLFLIDQEPFQAQVNQFDADLQTRQAELETKKAVAANKKADFLRIEQLAKDGAATEQQYTQALADQKESEAAVSAANASIASAEARLEQAKIDLKYATIQSPIDGYVSETYVDVGNLISAVDNKVLAKIVQASPIYVYFNISESDLLFFRKMRRERKDVEDPESQSVPKIEIKARLGGEKDFTIPGFIDYADVAVDDTTGTFMLRATLPNTESRVLPGYFVRIRAEGRSTGASLIIPETAIGYDQGGKFVMLATADGKAAMKDTEATVKKQYIEMGPELNGWRQVVSGLKETDSVITNGLQRVRDGGKVTATEKTAENPFAKKSNAETEESKTNPAE